MGVTGLGRVRELVRRFAPRAMMGRPVTYTYRAHVLSRISLPSLILPFYEILFTRQIPCEIARIQFSFSLRKFPIA